MKRYRTLKQAAQDDPGIFELKKGPNGRNLCRYCGTEVLPPRRTFCSDKCVHEWKIRSSPKYARACVRKRDKGICQQCGLNCTKLAQEIRQLPRDQRLKRAAELNIPKHRIGKSLWDMDHVLSVAEGGGLCSIMGLLTLCIWCHKKKTAELMKRLKKK